MRTDTLSSLIGLLHMRHLILQFLCYVNLEQVPGGRAVWQPGYEVFPRNLQQSSFLGYTLNSMGIVDVIQVHIVFANEVAWRNVAKHVLVYLSLIVFSIEFALHALSFDRVLLNFVHVLCLHILGIHTLGDYEVAFDNNIHFASRFTLPYEQTVLSDVQVVKVGCQAIERTSIRPRLNEQGHLLFHESDLLISLVQFDFFSRLRVVITMKGQEMCSFRAFNGGETWLTVDERQLSKGACTFKSSNRDHSFFVKVANVYRVSWIQDAIDVVSPRHERLLLHGNNFERTIIRLIFVRTQLICLMLFDVDLISQESIIFLFILFIEYLEEVLLLRIRI